MSTTLLIATAFDPDGSLKNNFVVANNLANVSVTARTIDQNSVTTDFITEGIANLYYTDERSRLAISVTGGGFYDNANGIITVGGPGLNTTNVIEGANLYFTNSRARLAISNVDGTIIYDPITGEIRANVSALGGGDNVVSVNGQTGVVTLNTTSIAEGSNLYFTNVRARAAFTAGQGISINNGQINVDATANVSLNEIFTKNFTVESASNANANIFAYYDGAAKALVINSNIELDAACVYHIGTFSEPLAELYAYRIETNTLIVANSIVADEFVGNLSGEIVKTISVTTDNNSLVIDTDNNPDLFLPKGTKVNFNVSADSLIGIGFDIGTFDAANNEIQNGGNLLGLSYIVNGAVVPTYEDWAASFNDANTRSIVYLIPQSAVFNTIYYAIQFNQWRGNVVVAPPASTDDLNEGGTNFYHTSQRVYDILSAVTDGNVGLIYDEQNNLLTMEQDLSIGSTPTFGNVTANSFHGGIFYGTFVGNITGSVANLDNLSTTDLKEGSNAYFTVSRLRTNLSAANGITYSSILGRFELANTNVTAAVYGTAANVPRITVDEYGRIQNVTPVPIFITTDSVAEGANLYFTEARVESALQSGVTDVNPNIDNSYDIGTNIKRWRNVFVATSVIFNDNSTITTARLNTDTLVEGSANLWYTDDRVWANVSSQLANVTANVGALTTTNVAEGANLYFTNARAQAAIFGGVGINYIAANGEINVAYDQTFGNVVASNVTILGNLYVVGNAVSFSANTLEINDPLIYLAANNYTSDVVDIGFIGNYYDGTNQRHAGLFRDATDKEFKLFDNVLQEATVEIDTANTSFRLANLHANYIYANIVGQVSSLGGLNTDDLPEGTANLYFTNARVWANISPRLAALTTDNIAEGLTNVYYSNTRVINDLKAGVEDIEPAVTEVYDLGAHDRHWRDIFTNFVVFEGNLRINSTFFDTANIAEANNLYFTNARARAAIGTANSTSLIYYENNGNFQVNVTNILGTTVSSVNGQTGTVVLTTANIAEAGANLYFSNTRVGDYLGAVLESIVPNASNIYDLGTQSARWRDLYLSGNSLYLGDLSLHDDGTGNLRIANATTGAIYNIIANTGSLIETGTKVFFSNDRVWANVSVALANVTANVTSLTTSNVAEGSNLYFTTDRVWANVGANIGNLNSWIRTLTTTGIAEGANLYFTNTRARAAVGTADSGTLIYYEANGRFQVNVETIGTVTSVNGQNGAVVLTTANIAESGANLYFSNARVYDALLNSTSNTKAIGVAKVYLQDGATNGIIFESPNALDYANIASVADGGATYLTFYVGDNAADLFKFYAPSNTNGMQFNDNVIWHAGNDGAGSTLDADLLDGQQGSFYVSNAYVGSLTTTQISEGANLYFTNARSRASVGTANSTSLIYYEANGNFQVNVEAVGSVTSVNGQTGAVSLTSTNIAEGANLYFTDSRAVTAVTNTILSNLTVGNVSIENDIFDSGINPIILWSNYSSALKWRNTSFGPGANSDTTITAANGIATIAISTGLLGFGSIYSWKFDESKLSFPDGTSQNTAFNTYFLTTSNVVENTNLYFTNARVWANVAPRIAELTTTQIAEGANLYFSNTRTRAAIGSANSTSLIYYEANGRFQINVESVGAVTSVNGQTGAVSLTTTNIAEGANLYFTNARSRAAISGGTGVTYDEGTGQISIGQAVGTANNVTFANVIVTGNLTVQGNALVFESNTLIINDPLIQVGKNPVGDAVDLGFFGHYVGGSPSVERHAGFFRDATDGNFKIFTNLDPEPDTIVDTGNASYRNANLVVDHVIGKVTDISNHTTTDLAEGSNLYYTDARVWANVGANIGNLNAWSSSNSANIGNLNTWVSVTNSNVGNLNTWVSSNSSNIGNLNTWVSSSSSNIGNLNSWLSITNSNIGNLNSWISSNSANIGLINASLANINSNVATLTTTGIAEGANLYFTNTRARAAVGAVGANLTYYEANGRLQFIVPGSNQQLIFNNNGQLGASSGLVFDGVSLKVTAGNLESLYQNGAEGGEIFLANAVTGTSVLEGVTIDVYGDKLRFFERGGTARGFYVDISTGGAGAGTNLVGGGGGTVTSVGSYTGAVSNAQLLGAVQSGGTSISFDQIHSSNNSYGTNFKVGDDAWIGDYNTANAIKIKGQQDAANGYVSFGSNSFALGVAGAGELTYGGNKVYHAGNDGAGSGLDADLLDNNSSSYYTLTTNHTEGTNLFFTNTRVRAAVGTANSASLIYYEANGNFQINVLAIPGSVSSVNGQTGAVTLTTANIAENGNLYYTDDRVWANVGSNIGNLNSWLVATNSNIGNLNSWVATHNTTTGIVEGTNLYFTNARARAAVGTAAANVKGLSYTESSGEFSLSDSGATAGNYGNATLIPQIVVDRYGRITSVSNVVAAGGGGGGGAVDSVNGQTGTVVLTTTNIAEGANLYYTNSRSRAALTAGEGITYIESNGYIAANLLSLNYAIAGLDRIVATEGQVNIQLSGSISDIDQYMVYLNGVLLDSNVDYSNTTSNIVLSQAANINDVVHVQKALVVDTTNFVNSSFQNVTLNGNVKLQHKVFEDAILNPANGAIQSKYVTTNTVFTETFTNGDNMVLHLNGGSGYAVSWPNMRWVSALGNVAPTLTANDTLVFWKIENVLYGIYSGSSA